MLGPDSEVEPYIVRPEDSGRTIHLRVAAESDDALVETDAAPTAVVTGPVAGNLAPDADFETDPDGSYYTHGMGTFSWATDQAHSSAHALRVVSGQPSGATARWMTIIPAIPVTPGAAYDVSAWMKVQDVNHGNAQLVVTFWSAARAYVAGSAYASPATITGTTDWTQLALAARAPAGSAFMRIEFRLTGPGTMWADDVVATG